MMTTVSLVISLFFLVIIALGALFGMKRGWFKASTRLGVIIIAAILTALLTAVTANTAIKTAGPEFIKAFSEAVPPDVATLLFGDPMVSEFAIAIMISLVAPIVFVVLFSIICPLSGLFGLLFKAIDSKFNLTDKLPSAASMGIGALCGALGSFIVFAALTSPLTGYLYAAQEAVEVYSATEGERFSEWDEYVDPICDNFMLKSFHTFGGGLIFNSVSRVKLGSTRFAIVSEARNLVKLLPALKDFSLETLDSEKIDRIINTINNSEVLPEIAAHFLSSAAEEWAQGNAYMGIELPRGEGAMDSIIGSVIEILLQPFRNLIYSVHLIRLTPMILWIRSRKKALFPLSSAQWRKVKVLTALFRTL